MFLSRRYKATLGSDLVPVFVKEDGYCIEISIDCRGLERILRFVVMSICPLCPKYAPGKNKTHKNASTDVAHGTPRLWYLFSNQQTLYVLRQGFARLIATYIFVANSGNTAPAIERMKVLIAIAEFE